MSEISGGTAPNGCNAGGSWSGLAGSAGMVITLRAAQRSVLPSARLASSRCHSHTEAERSSTLITTPTNPQALEGSWAGRTSNTNWCWSPRSTRWTSVRSDRLQKFRWCPKRRPSRSSGSRPFSNIDGVAHSEVITVS